MFRFKVISSLHKASFFLPNHKHSPTEYTSLRSFHPVHFINLFLLEPSKIILIHHIIKLMRTCHANKVLPTYIFKPSRSYLKHVDRTLPADQISTKTGIGSKPKPELDKGKPIPELVIPCSNVHEHDTKVGFILCHTNLEHKHTS